VIPSPHRRPSRGRCLAWLSSPALLAGLACSLAAPPVGDAAEPAEGPEVPTATATAAKSPVPTYARDIRPILADACFNCHGFDAAERKAGLRLDTPEGAYAEKDGVRSVVPGDLAASEAWHRIRSADPLDRMPPPDFHHRLSPGQIELLERWIAAGAVYEDHWAFVPPTRPPLPEPPPPSASGDGARAPRDTPPHPVDAFLEARLAHRPRLRPRPRPRAPARRGGDRAA